jgi:DNA modification methylase
VNLGTAQVIRANSRNLPLADDSVDLVVTSPPYFALRSYQDGGEHYAGQIGDEPTPAEFVDSLLEVTRECVRVLKPSGSLWVNLGDKYAGVGGPNQSGEAVGDTARRQAATQNKLYEARTRNAGGVRSKSLFGIPWRYALRCIDDLGLILRAEVIWSKPNGLPESVTDRVRRSHEQWFHFTLQPRYFSAVDEIREPHSEHTTRYYAPGVRTEPRGGKNAERREGGVWHADPSGQGLNAVNPLGKLPGSVWTIPTEPLKVPDHLGVDHFAAFPTAWPRKIISAWAPEDGTVLDPFGGTGTTAMVAKALGRHGVSVDMSADYCRLAEWRTNDRNQLAKVLGIEKTEAPDPDQMDLFGGDAA